MMRARSWAPRRARPAGEPPPATPEPTTEERDPPMSWTQRLKKAGRSEEAVAHRAASEAPGPNLPPVAPVDAKTLTREAIVELLREDLVLISEGKLARDEIDPRGHLFDYGYVDSLSAVIFLARIEERFGTQIEDVELIESTTDLLAIADRVRRAD